MAAVVAAMALSAEQELLAMAAKKEECEALREASAVSAGDLLEVVGGASSGGIIVREGKDKASAEAAARLAAGAIVRAVAVEDGRVQYELVRGSGPASGWVSSSAAGKALLSKIIDGDVPEEALAYYSHRLVEARKAGKGDFIFDRMPCAIESLAPKSAKLAAHEQRPGAGAAELVMQAERHRAAAEGADAAAPGRRSAAGGRGSLLRRRFGGGRGAVAEDSDGEEMILCKHCSLPLGEFGYAQEGANDKRLMHGECMAQVMLQGRRADEAQRKRREVELKRARREEYDIGWKASTIPSNAAAAEKLGCEVVPQGLCCLVLEDEGASVRLAPTFEPAGALNLEYLSIALQVRRREGREPFFSLDPIEAARRDLAEASMQAKRFEPEWIAGTSVGEVMFQADYYLKELSMGEYDQPVIGMKSCFDYTTDKDADKEWSAREWFVVRKAELHLSEDAVLIPYLKMGVEAREQVLNPLGDLEDAPLTRPDHPLVRYAEAFTKNFDLIAERRGVVAQLREVAKASIVAKFMLEAGVQLEEPWFSLGEATGVACCLEVPQLWNDRCFAKIHVQDGEIATSEKHGEARVHSVYGGVDFGIDRFRLAAPSRVATSVVAGRAALGRPASTLMATSQAGLSMEPGQRFTRLAAPLSARAALTAPSRLAPPLSARAGLAAPLSAMAAARPATSLMATSRASMAAPQARLAAPLRASMAAPSRLAAPLSARASLAAPLSAMAGARPATSLMATSRLSVGAPGRLAAPLSAMTAARPASSLMATSRISMAAPQTATARLSMGMPRGVDLNLDKFNLSSVVSPEDGSLWAGTVEAPAGSERLTFGGEAFWSGLDRKAAEAPAPAFDAEDAALLSSVFHPQLSDRRQEGAHFVPPPTALSYMHRLKMLVKEEASVMQKRREQFFGASFDADDAGSLFPSSWTSSIGLASPTSATQGSSKAAMLTPRPDLKAEEGMLLDVLGSATPVFEKCVEDGTKFLIFRLGSLEVRATQEPGASGVEIGAVFSLGAASSAAPRCEVRRRSAVVAQDSEAIAKAALYVEPSPCGAFRFFVALRTSGGHALAAEQLADGTVAWLEGADDVASRCSLAKLLREAGEDGAAPAVSLGELRALLSGIGAAKASASARKQFAQALFQRCADR